MKIQPRKPQKITTKNWTLQKPENHSLQKLSLWHLDFEFSRQNRIDFLALHSLGTIFLDTFSMIFLVFLGVIFWYFLVVIFWYFLVVIFLNFLNFEFSCQNFKKDWFCALIHKNELLNWKKSSLGFEPGISRLPGSTKYPLTIEVFTHCASFY